MAGSTIKKGSGRYPWPIEKEFRAATGDYMVVSETKKRSKLYWQYLSEYLAKNNIACRVYYDNRYYYIDLLGSHVKIRFVSERQFFDASTGYHGWVVTELQVEQWLNAAEVGNEE